MDQFVPYLHFWKLKCCQVHGEGTSPSDPHSRSALAIWPHY